MATKKSERLLELMELLRRHRRPVTGQFLAEELGVTLRTLYRDIEALRGLGAAVEGEAGVGYQLRADFFLPPMMMTSEELEALVLGLRTVIYGPDRDMGRQAESVRAKIAASLPKDMRETMDSIGLFAIPIGDEVERSEQLALVRTALRDERELVIDYVDGKGARTERTVWPVALGYIGRRQMLAAWCTMRGDYRSFWIDRMQSIQLGAKSTPRPRRTLIHEWRARTGAGDLS